MELDAQAALDKAVAIAKRGDASVLYLNADLDKIPKPRNCSRPERGHDVPGTAATPFELHPQSARLRIEHEVRRAVAQPATRLPRSRP